MHFFQAKKVEKHFDLLCMKFPKVKGDVSVKEDWNCEHKVIKGYIRLL